VVVTRQRRKYAIEPIDNQKNDLLAQSQSLVDHKMRNRALLAPYFKNHCNENLTLPIAL